MLRNSDGGQELLGTLLPGWLLAPCSLPSPLHQWAKLRNSDGGKELLGTLLPGWLLAPCSLPSLVINGRR